MTARLEEDETREQARTRTHTRARTHTRTDTSHIRGRAVRAARAGRVCARWVICAACAVRGCACGVRVCRWTWRAPAWYPAHKCARTCPLPARMNQGVRASHAAGAARGCWNPSRARRVAMPPPRPDGPRRPGKSCRSRRMPGPKACGVRGVHVVRACVCVARARG